MNDYIIVLIILGVIYWLSLSRSTKQKKRNHSHSPKIGETTVYKMKKNESKMKVEAEDADFEEIVDHEK